jgi:hypothetical protein
MTCCANPETNMPTCSRLRVCPSDLEESGSATCYAFGVG